MKILKFDNLSAIVDAPEVAQIRYPVAAGATVTIKLDNNNGLAQNDYLLIGEIGGTQSEIAQISAAVVAGTDIVVSSLKFPHNAGVKVYLLKYNQVKFYHTDTLTGSKTIITTAAIDVDNLFTEYRDGTNSTGYLFFTLYNSTTADESGYSGAYPYSLLKNSSRANIRAIFKGLYQRTYDESLFELLCDAVEAEIYAIRRWRFREKRVVFNSAASQQSYTLAEAGAEDLGQLIYATYDGDPLEVIRMKTHKRLNWSTIVTTIPRAIWEWEGSLYMTPTPDGIKVIELYYYKNSSGFTDDTTETGVQLPLAIAARLAQHFWTGEDDKKASSYEKLFLQTISAMKMNDIKQVSVFPSLTDNRLANTSVLNQIDYPSIEIP
jgi:hypothetical protein